MDRLTVPDCSRLFPGTPERSVPRSRSQGREHGNTFAALPAVVGPEQRAVVGADAALAIAAFISHAENEAKRAESLRSTAFSSSRSAGERIVDGHTSRRSSARSGLIHARFVGVAGRNVTLESSSLLTEMRAPAIRAAGNARAKTPGATGAERESAKRWLGVMGRPLAAAPVTSHAATAAVRQAP